MAEIAILLDAKAATLAPGERLVVPEAASVEADVATDRAHVAQHRRGYGRCRFREYRIVSPQV